MMSKHDRPRAEKTRAGQKIELAFRRSAAALLAGLALMFWGGNALQARPENIRTGETVVAQRKQYDRGNCYQWKRCKGDSIGNAWVHDPCFCTIQGGRSWMDASGKCHDLIDGPFGTECR